MKRNLILCYCAAKVWMTVVTEPLESAPLEENLMQVGVQKLGDVQQLGLL